MTNALQRSSFSPIVRDQRDMACGVFAGPGRELDVVALAEGCMLHICTAPYNVRELVKEYGPRISAPATSSVRTTRIAAATTSSTSR